MNDGVDRDTTTHTQLKCSSVAGSSDTNVEVDKGITPHTRLKCSSVAGSSDMNDEEERISHACNNCWFIESRAQCSEDTHASDL